MRFLNQFLIYFEFAVFKGKIIKSSNTLFFKFLKNSRRDVESIKYPMGAK